MTLIFNKLIVLEEMTVYGATFKHYHFTIVERENKFSAGLKNFSHRKAMTDWIIHPNKAVASFDVAVKACIEYSEKLT